MDEPVLHKASNTQLYRRVLFPDELDFKFFLRSEEEGGAEIMFMDIHDNTTVYKAKKALYEPIYVTTHRGIQPSDKDNIYLSQFVFVSGAGRSFWAHPATWLERFVREHTFTGGGLKVIHHAPPDGRDEKWSLVVFEESRILGGSWLAYVRTETVPSPEGLAQTKSPTNQGSQEEESQEAS